MVKLQRKRKSMKRMKGGYSSNINPAQSSATFSPSPNAVGASSYVENNYGNTNQQYNDVFDINSKTLGNTFTTLPDSQQPSASSLNLVQSAGKRQRRKGGMGIGETAATAAVPLGLLYLQNKYGKKSRKSRKRTNRRTFKNKRGGSHCSTGGRRKKSVGKSHKKKGGMFAQILSNAIVPFGLLAANTRYGKKSRKNRK